MGVCLLQECVLSRPFFTTPLYPNRSAAFSFLQEIFTMQHYHNWHDAYGNAGNHYHFSIHLQIPYKSFHPLRFLSKRFFCRFATIKSQSSKENSKPDSISILKIQKWKDPWSKSCAR